MFLPRLFIAGFAFSLFSLSFYLISKDFPQKYQLKFVGQEKVLGLTLKSPQKFVKEDSPSPTPSVSTLDLEISHKVNARLSTPKPKAAPQIKQASAATAKGAQTASDILNALNSYRAKKGVGALAWDQKLADFSNSRVSHFSSIGNIDNHAGFRELLNNDGFTKMGFWMLAENSSTGFKGNASELIESFYGKSSGHDANQLNPSYSHVGIGVQGLYTNLVFGGRKK
jgi:uncharacterized protein YkwD